LLAVVIEHHGQVAAQGFLLQLAAGEALHGLLHRAQFVETLAHVGQTVFHDLPRAGG